MVDEIEQIWYMFATWCSNRQQYGKKGKKILFIIIV